MVTIKGKARLSEPRSDVTAMNVNNKVMVDKIGKEQMAVTSGAT